MDQEINLTEKAKLGLKIEMVAQKIGALSKDGENKHSNYNYISAEKMTTALRDELSGSNLSIVPSVTGHSEINYVNDKSKTVVRSTVDVQFTLTDLETGYQEIHNWAGADQDTGGKSMQQALTQAVKYFYFKLFKISSKEDVDGDSKTQEGVPEAKKNDSTPEEDNKPWLNADTKEFANAVKAMKEGKTIDDIRKHYRVSKKMAEQLATFK